MIGAYDPIIAEASRRFGVPEERIRAVMKVESNAQPWSRSPKGASGLMQVMPNTYTELAKRHGLGPDRFNPTNNIMAGTAYLGEMYDQFGNWDEATQAYNMGPGRAMQVRNGTATVPGETTDYLGRVNGVLANFTPPQGGQGGNVVPGLMRPRPGQTTGMEPMFGGPRAGSWTGLLEADEDKNYADGLGLLGNAGQTPSQPPRTDPAALPGTTQTDRLDVSGRINELLQQYLQQPQKAMPSQLQYMLAGAQKGMAGLTGVHDRPVGIGEMLGALGGGVTSGGLAYDEAAQQRQGGELGKLLQVGAYQNQSRTAELNEANSIIENRLKVAQTNRANRAEIDPKVVGKWIYEGGQWKAPPGSTADGGPFDGTSIDAQMYNTVITLQQKLASGQTLTPQETYQLDLAKRHLTQSRQTVNEKGQVVDMAPAPLPSYPGAPSAAPPPQAAPPAGTAQPPSQDTTVKTPSGATVTTIGGANLPAGEQTALRKQIDGLNALKGSAIALGNNVEKTGMQIGAIGALGGTQSALYEDLQTKLRLANELGVLNGPDERKLLEQISDPTRLSAYIRGLGGPSYFNAQMKVLQDKINREIAQYEERLGIKKPDGGAGGGGSAGGPTTVLKLDAQGNIVK